MNNSYSNMPFFPTSQPFYSPLEGQFPENYSFSARNNAPGSRYILSSGKQINYNEPRTEIGVSRPLSLGNPNDMQFTKVWVDPRNMYAPCQITKKPSFSLSQQHNYYNNFSSLNTPNVSGEMGPNNRLMSASLSETKILDKPKVVLPPIKRIFDDLEKNVLYDLDPPHTGVVAKLKQIQQKKKLPPSPRRYSITYDDTNSSSSHDFAAFEPPSSFLPPIKKEENRCSTCFKCFKKPSTLKRHLITHTDSKPFVCTYCGRGFNVKHNLVRHAKRHDEITKQAAVNILLK